MSLVKVVISVEANQLKKIDFYAKQHGFKNRSEVFQFVLTDRLKRLSRSRLARECAKLDIPEEQALGSVNNALVFSLIFA